MSLILPLPSYFLNVALQIFRKEQCFMVGSRDSFHSIKKYKLYVEFCFQKIELRAFRFHLFHHCTSFPRKQGFLKTDVCLPAFFSNQIFNIAERAEQHLRPTLMQITREFWNSMPAEGQLGPLKTLGPATNSTLIYASPYQAFMIYFGLVELSLFQDRIRKLLHLFQQRAEFCMVHTFCKYTYEFNEHT